MHNKALIAGFFLIYWGIMFWVFGFWKGFLLLGLASTTVYHSHELTALRVAMNYVYIRIGILEGTILGDFNRASNEENQESGT